MYSPVFPCVTYYCWFQWNVSRCEKIILIVFSPYVATSPSSKGHFNGMIHLSNFRCRRIQTYTGFKMLTASCLSENVDLQCSPSLDVSSHIGYFFLNSVSLFSKPQCSTTLELLFCLTPSVLSLHLRHLTSVYRGFCFSPPARFSPGTIGALLFPAAFHAPQKSSVFEPAFGLMAMLKTSLCEAWKTKESTSAAPRGRWKRSWLWKSGTWPAARLWAAHPTWTDSTWPQITAQNSSQAWSLGAQQLKLPEKPNQSCVTTIPLPPVPQRSFTGGADSRPLSVQVLPFTPNCDSHEGSLVEGQNLSRLCYS